MKISKKWSKIQEVYLHFANEKELELFNFSEDAAMTMYIYESTGKKRGSGKFLFENGKHNGYAVMKSKIDITVSMWNYSINYEYPRLLNPYELYQDFHESLHWWLDKVLIWDETKIPSYAKNINN